LFIIRIFFFFYLIARLSTGVKRVHIDNTFDRKTKKTRTDNNDSNLYNLINPALTDASSYIMLPTSIENKPGTNNPQNNDQKCFKWAILAKHVTELPKYRVCDNYFGHEAKHNFLGLSFPTPLLEVKVFERNNPHVSVNIYGLEKKF